VEERVYPRLALTLAAVCFKSRKLEEEEEEEEEVLG